MTAFLLWFKYEFKPLIMTPPNDANPGKINGIAHFCLLSNIFSTKIECLFGNRAGITFLIL